MTKEERAEQSRLRAAEHQRRKRTRMLLVIVGAVLYVAVPLIWYGAVEFGWVQPIRTPEFKNAIQTAGIVALILIVFNLDVFYPDTPKKKIEDKEKAPAVNQVSAQ